GGWARSVRVSLSPTALHHSYGWLTWNEADSTFAICSLLSSRCARTVSSVVECFSPSAWSMRLAISRRCSRARLRASAGAPPPRSTNSVRRFWYSRWRFRRITDDLADADFSPLGRSEYVPSVRQ